jgi:hypothetical protein
VRALSGLIGKANNKNITYSTSTATIGIRGTDVLIRCTGTCAGEAAAPGQGLEVFTYAGSVDVTKLTDFTSTFVLPASQGLIVDADGTRGTQAAPANDLTPPGDMAIPPALFFSEVTPETREGLYVFVRDGHIELTTSSEVLHLGRNETGLAGNDGNVIRPQDVPRFLEFDRTPLPNSSNINTALLLGDSNIGGGRICR